MSPAAKLPWVKDVPESLLPLDGSALAEQALPHGVTQAERFQAELILLKALEPLADRQCR